MQPASFVTPTQLGRVSAYGFDPRGLRWELFVRLARSRRED